jgi:hypothetical protein
MKRVKKPKAHKPRSQNIPKDKKQCNIGGDDGAGVLITLAILSKLPNQSFIFTKDEETGMK